MLPTLDMNRRVEEFRIFCSTGERRLIAIISNCDVKLVAVKTYKSC